MSRSLNRARSEVDAAVRDRDRWAKVAVDAESAAAAAAAVDVTDPSELDAVGDAAVRTAGKAVAARRALAKAEQRLADARRAALLAEAADEASDADTFDREHSALRGKVTALLDQLEALDGVRYEPVTAEGTYDQRRHGPPTSQVFAMRRLDVLAADARLHRVRAAVLRATAATGCVPGFHHELDVQFDGVWGSSLIELDAIPDTARAYVAAMSEAAGVAGR